MKYWIVILQLTLSFSLTAQETQPEKDHTLSIGGFYSAAYTRGNLGGSYGYSTGPDLLWKFSTKFRARVGVHFTSIGERKKDMTFITGHGLSGFIYKTFTYYHKYHFLEVPLQADYFLTQRKVRIFLLAGVTPGYFLERSWRYDEQLPDDKTTKGKTSTTSDNSYLFTISGSIGCGMEMKLHERWSIQLEPTFRYYFNSDKFSAIGLNAGIIYNIF